MKYLKGKTWIDWVKVIVAIDIAAVGIGLIFQQQIHILAGVFGSVSRIVFGILYILVAASIFKIVFPQIVEDLKGRVSEPKKKEEEKAQAEEVEQEETVGEMIDKTAQKINTFVAGKAQEAKEELQKDLTTPLEESQEEEEDEE